MTINLKAPGGYNALPTWEAFCNGRSVEFQANGTDDLAVIAAGKLQLAYIQPYRHTAHADGSGPRLGEILVLREPAMHPLPTTDHRAFRDGVRVQVESFLARGSDGALLQMNCRSFSGKLIILSDSFNYERPVAE